MRSDNYKQKVKKHFDNNGDIDCMHLHSPKKVWRMWDRANNGTLWWDWVNYDYKIKGSK